MPRFAPLCAAAFAAALLAGCQTYSPNRSTMISGSGSSRNPRGGNYTSPYEEPQPASGWESRPSSAPVSRSAAAAREATRLSELETAVSRLQGQVDSMSAAQENVVAQANATVSRSSSSLDSLRTEIETLRAEVAALKAENRALRDEQASQRSQIAALPDKISRAVAASMPKTPARPAQTSGRSRECYEHIVAQGDTVSAIASAYHVTTAEIVRENNLKDAGAIRVGQTLYIPKK